MFSLLNTSVRASSRTVCAQCLRKTNTHRLLTSSTATPMKASADLRSLERRRIVAALPKFQVRNYASKSSADQIVEDIQEQYATARDEFEIAAEETQKKSIYAADDRAAAREELTALKELYEKALEGTDGDEVKRRVGQRIRELDTAVEELNKADYED